MSPEQAAGRLDRMGPASDIYSLGATLYFVLTGKPPFQSDDGSASSCSARSSTASSRRPSQVNPRVDRALDAICKKAMALDPDDRYATVRAARRGDRALAGRRAGFSLARAAAKAAGAVGPPPQAAGGRRGLAGDRRPDRAGIGTLLLGQANRRVQEQRDLARSQRDLASENFQKARQAVDIFLTNVSEEQLLNQPGLQPLRQKLLRSALDYYQGFVRQRADDPTLRRQLAEAYWRLGEINGVLGNRPGGDRRARAGGGDLRAVACGGARRMSSSRSRCARALQALGYYRLRNDEADPGERALRSAIELLEPLERDHPEVAEYGRRLGRCYDLLGVVGIVSGRSAQYLPYWDKAVAVLERTIARHPQELEARAFLVKALYNRGSGLEGLDNFEGALRSARQAVEQGRQLQKLVPENPSDSVRLRNVARIPRLCTRSSTGPVSVGGAEQLRGGRVAPAAECGQSRRGPLQELALPGHDRRAQARVRLGQHARAELQSAKPQAIARYRWALRLHSIGSSARGSPSSSIARGISLAEAGPVVRGIAGSRGQLATLRGLVPQVLRTIGSSLPDLIEARADLVEARLRAGRISLPRRSPRSRRSWSRQRPTRAGSTGRRSASLRRDPVPTGGTSGRGRQIRRGRIDAGAKPSRATGVGDGVPPPAIALEARPGPGRFAPRRASPKADRGPSPRRRPPRRGTGRAGHRRRTLAISMSWARSRQPTATRS